MHICIAILVATFLIALLCPAQNAVQPIWFYKTLDSINNKKNDNVQLNKRKNLQNQGAQLRTSACLLHLSCIFCKVHKNKNLFIKANSKYCFWTSKTNQDSILLTGHTSTHCAQGSETKWNSSSRSQKTHEHCCSGMSLHLLNPNASNDQFLSENTGISAFSVN